MEAADGRSRATVSRIVKGLFAEEAERQGSAATARGGGRAAMQQIGVKDDHVTGLDRKRNDIPDATVGFDLGQTRERRCFGEWSGVVGGIESRAVVERAVMRASHELQRLRGLQSVEADPDHRQIWP